MAHIIQNSWRKEHGICQVRVFERARLFRGANYVGGDVDWGKNRYEIGKFGNVNATVYFSRRAEETLQQLSQGPATAQ